jgi:alkylation response protein AidB-like acyl-CoA dehydrogenase
MTVIEVGRVREAVASVAALVREQADEVEQQCRMTDDIVAAFRESGINRIYLPAELGGTPLTPRESLDVVAEISAADASAGWCTLIGAGSAIFAGYLPEASAREIWTDPDGVMAGVFNPRGNAIATGRGDRYTVTGRWPFASNCLHSSWLGLAAWFRPTPDADPEPVPRLAFVPRDAAEIHDTWDVAGLRGTGSHDVSVTNVDVRRAYSCALNDQTWPDDPVWRLTLLVALAPGLVAVPLGAARGALDELVQQAQAAGSRMRGAVIDDPIAMADLARADAMLRAARAGLEVALDEAWEQALRGDRTSRPTQARVLMAAQYACDVAVEVVDAAHRLSGSAGVYRGSRMLRRLHDVQTARQHIAFGHGSRMLFGQVLCGRDLFVPPIIV